MSSIPQIKAQKITNGIYVGAKGRSSLFDLEIPKNNQGEIIVFVHGFMGFKDWGAWNLVQQFFVSHGYGFAKLNLSHNGGTVMNGMNFPDEEAFAQNTYSKEVEDLIRFQNHIKDLTDQSIVFTLIGHSRGGGIAALSCRQVLPKRLILWASISDIAMRFADEAAMLEWKKEGRRFVLNGRTRQKLPQDYALYEDFKTHADVLNIEQTIRDFACPSFVIHGTKDEAVSIEEGQNLAEFTNTKLVSIENANHVFGASHPWTNAQMPKELEEVCKLSLDFINS